MVTSLTSIGNDIKTFRIEAGLSQEDLAKLCGVERSQLSRIEAGEVLGVTFATIEKILNSLGRSISYSKKDNSYQKLNIKPFVKWAGGKTQLLDVIQKHLPVSFNRYFEPFVGGGALLFKIQPSAFSINDMNSELISVYECFQNDELYKALIEELDTHEANHSEEYFYKIRALDQNSMFNALPKYVHAGRMIYLNKACFNGLYRVNSKGFFNVPSGKKSSITCYDRNNFAQLKEFFRNKKIVITNQDFETAVKNVKKYDFVYFDPPYDVIEGKDNFTSYDKSSFGKNEQIRLANLFKNLSKKGVYVMLSNHNTQFIRDLYKDFHITIVPAKRMINSKADGRGDVEEVLITNYE